MDGCDDFPLIISHMRFVVGDVALEYSFDLMVDADLVKDSQTVGKHAYASTNLRRNIFVSL